jgi:hypothetical protein
VAWLHHSSRTCAGGRMLEAMCKGFGLHQHVRSPTREKHLLDLVFSNKVDVRCTVCPPISDHCLVLAKFGTVLPGMGCSVRRTLWDFKQVNWRAFARELARLGGLGCQDPHEHLSQGVMLLMRAVRKHVPARTATERRDSKGWLPIGACGL